MGNYFWVKQLVKLVAVGAILLLVYWVKHWTVATMAVIIIGTLIASEGFLLLLIRSWRKEPTDENVVKLFITMAFLDKDLADKILDDYRKEKAERVTIAELQKR